MAQSVKVALCAAQEHADREKFLGELFSGFTYLFSGFVLFLKWVVCVKYKRSTSVQNISA